MSHCCWYDMSHCHVAAKTHNRPYTASRGPPLPGLYLVVRVLVAMPHPVSSALQGGPAIGWWTYRAPGPMSHACKGRVMEHPSARTHRHQQANIRGNKMTAQQIGAAATNSPPPPPHRCRAGWSAANAATPRPCMLRGQVPHHTHPCTEGVLAEQGYTIWSTHTHITTTCSQVCPVPCIQTANLQRTMGCAHGTLVA